MVQFWKHVNQVLSQADLILEVLDARFIEESRNPEIEAKIRQQGKQIIYVINKCDLVEVEKLKETIKGMKQHLQPSIFISSTDKFGTTILKKKILELSRGKGVTVAVVGYPNVGKSSVINALAGRKAARTSPQSGFTHGVQRIRVGPKIVLLDTPGVFPWKEKDDWKHAVMGAVDYAKVKDPEAIVLKLIEHYQPAITKFYGVAGSEPEEILENVARRLQRLRTGGVPDTEAAARIILKEWQRGTIKEKVLLKKELISF